MTRLWLRIAIATVAIVATLVVAVDTFVIRPAADESARAAATAAATEATLVAQLVRRGEVPPGVPQSVTDASCRCHFEIRAQSSRRSGEACSSSSEQLPWPVQDGRYGLEQCEPVTLGASVERCAKWAALILLRPCRRKLRRSSTSLASSTDSEQRWLSRCYRRPNSSASWRTIYAAH